MADTTSGDPSSSAASAAPSTPSPQPPSTPAWVEVKMDTNGVNITWAEAQPGDYPLTHYTLKKSSDNITYNVVATVDINTTAYVDTQGQVGDWYQITAGDNQDPVNESAPTTAVQVPDQTNTTAVDTTNTPSSTTPTDSTTTVTSASPDTATAALDTSSAPTTDQSASQSTLASTDAAQVVDSPDAVKAVVAKTNIDSLLSTSGSENLSNLDSSVNLTAAHPLTEPAAQDTEVNKLYTGMSDTTNMTVNDVPSLTAQVNENDSHATVQTPSNRAKILSSYSDNHIVNLLNSVTQGKKVLVAPLLNRYNYEKNSIIQLHDRLSSDDIKTAQSRCSTQEDILNTTVLNLPNDEAYLAIQGLANCRVIHAL